MTTSSATRGIQIDASIDKVFAFVADPVKAMEATTTLGRVVVGDVVTTPEGGSHELDMD